VIALVIEKEEADVVILNPSTNILEEGCSVHEIDFDVVSMRQLVTLSQMSSECRQFNRVILAIYLFFSELNLIN